MRYPKFLSQNERIGFIAPSFGCAGLEPYYSRFQSALLYFRAMGYKTVCGPNVFLDKGIGKSNTPSECGLEINDFFLDDRSDIIISASGGETMCEDLDHVDFIGRKVLGDTGFLRMKILTLADLFPDGLDFLRIVSA